MRSPESLGCAVVLACAAIGAQAAAAEPTQAEVEAVKAQLATDPELGGTTTERQFRYKPSEVPDKPKPKEERDVPEWLITMGRFISSAGRWVVWILGGVALIFVLLGVRRWMQAGALTRGRRLADLPSHVRDLDIRPDSLPQQVGDAAWAAWQRGEHRAALSLLYRATLSRLVHVHGVSILSASTEGECVQLARSRLPAQPLAFVEQVVTAWQMAVYGGRNPDTATVQHLCRNFDLELPGPLKGLTSDPANLPTPGVAR
ncbi:MAG: DUF4129 domain-containing protein [Pseudomonadota bacterium]